MIKLAASAAAGSSLKASDAGLKAACKSGISNPLVAQDCSRVESDAEIRSTSWRAGEGILFGESGSDLCRLYTLSESAVPVNDSTLHGRLHVWLIYPLIECHFLIVTPSVRMP